MATSVQHVLSLTRSHGYRFSSCMKSNCKLIGSACDWPHYVIKFTVFECSSGILQGIYLFYWGFSLCNPTQGTITLVCLSITAHC